MTKARIGWLGLLGSVLFFAMNVTAPFLRGQQPTYKPGEYPAPRYPKLPKNPKLEDLMPIARDIVKRGDVEHQFYPGYAIKAGERVLLMVSREYDAIVIEALTRVIREAGAKVDVLLGDAVTPNSKDGTYKGDGSEEFDYFTFLNEFFKAQTGGLDQPTQVAIALAGKYNIAISGSGGGHPNYPRDKMRWAYIPWKTVDLFLGSGSNIPPALLRFLDDTAWAALSKAVSIHATDPEGTDITWSVKPGDWQRAGAGHPSYAGHNVGHLMAHPAQGSASGVLGGTFSHTGPFPHVRASFKNDRMEGIEGGGAYGQKWRAARGQWKDVSWSTKPGPGLFTWLIECAIGTIPKSARGQATLERAMGSIWDRTRSGVIHWGIGAGQDPVTGAIIGRLDTMGEDNPTGKFFKAHTDVPDGHVHIHTYFTTMILTNADGTKTTFINRGHLTALDDPRVRQEAAKYGDPDKLLSEDWIPAIPGINASGNYMQDYANDPEAWIRKDLAANWK